MALNKFHLNGYKNGHTANDAFRLRTLPTRPESGIYAAGNEPGRVGFRFR